MRAILLASATPRAWAACAPATPEPWRRPAAARLACWIRRSHRYQHGAQPLISGAGDPAEPGLAGGRMVLGRQPDPGRVMPAGPERARIGRLHHQAGRRSGRSPGSPPDAGCRLARCQAISLARSPSVRPAVAGIPGRARRTSPGLLLAGRHPARSAPAAARSCPPPWRRSGRTRRHGRGSCCRAAYGSDKPSRTPSSICAAYCASLLTGTNCILGRSIASQAFGVEGVVLAAPTEGFTYCGGSSPTVWPSFLSSRAQWWEAPHASIPITIGAGWRKRPIPAAAAASCAAPPFPPR